MYKRERNHRVMLLRYIVILVLGTCLASCSKPVAGFIFDPGPEEAPAEINFQNESKNAITYRWDFGDGNTSSDVSPTHRYLQSGNYEITTLL